MSEILTCREGNYSLWVMCDFVAKQAASGRTTNTGAFDPESSLRLLNKHTTSLVSSGRYLPPPTRALCDSNCKMCFLMMEQAFTDCLQGAGH